MEQFVCTKCRMFTGESCSLFTAETIEASMEVCNTDEHLFDDNGAEPERSYITG